MSILYEDDLFLIANKPAGIPVHETKDPMRADFTRQIQERLGFESLRTVNRLDLGTSGIVVFGKNPDKNKEIDEIFLTAEKEYILIGSGIPDWTENKFECFLKDGNKKVTIVRSGGKKSITHFKILASNTSQKIFLAKAKLLTGRRHQIRISSASLGFPILGDTVYGPVNQKWKRTYLHSFKLKFVKKDMSEIEILCPPPSEFLKLFPDINTLL
ncbi:RluA family pseudouridine synthase [Leptospira ognonensis]|uniref:RluA family pseudouridine synthase n=1 Tax=Leptospira ognonensis TaxID=2484945 RepID=A0A4R9K1S7_9LEPT|nr:RluA family pseudouridine synthase [Leptospira ognonensis]TGL59669.1 RluA family pseudouridine synthase [Leptospira ognonensis]